MKAVIIRANNSRELVEFTKETSYGMIKAAVDGIFDCVSLPNYGVDMWCNDEGQIIGLDPNEFASDLYLKHYPWLLKGLSPSIYQYAIRGDVIITGMGDEEGYTMGLTDQQAEMLLKGDDKAFFEQGQEETLEREEC